MKEDTGIEEPGRGVSLSVPIADKKKQKYSRKLTEAIATQSASYIEWVLSSLKEVGFSARDIKDIVNMPDAKGDTPLLKLLERTFPDWETCVKQLLSLGADPFFEPVEGKSALHYICSYWNPDCFKGILRELLLAGNESDKSFALSPAGVAKPPLVLMSLNGRLTPEIIHIFADAGANMCATDSDGNTALSPEVFLRGWTDLIFKGAPISPSPSGDMLI